MQVSVPDYLRMTGLKTAPLFRAAASIGAQVGGGSAEQVRLLSRFGHELGLAYQIRDDLLGMWGDPGRIGKPVGSDLRQNKRSLPIVLALASDDPQLRAQVEEALSRGVGSEEEAASLAAEIEADGVRGACQQFADRYLDRALRHLRKAGLRDESAADLQALATYLVHRQE
jgi:geranylgeranyl diphosphate synthase type I